MVSVPRRSDTRGGESELPRVKPGGSILEREPFPRKSETASQRMCVRLPSARRYIIIVLTGSYGSSKRPVLEYASKCFELTYGLRCSLMSYANYLENGLSWRFSGPSLGRLCASTCRGERSRTQLRVQRGCDVVTTKVSAHPQAVWSQACSRGSGPIQGSTQHLLRRRGQWVALGMQRAQEVLAFHSFPVLCRSLKPSVCMR